MDENEIMKWFGSLQNRKTIPNDLQIITSEQSLFESHF
jgi:hypothetical protein